MSSAPEQPLLNALLDSWDRSNTILVNLLRAIPDGAMELRPMESSPSIAQLFAHVHYVRLIFVSEDAPEFATKMPEREWADVSDREAMAARLNESAKLVRVAVAGRLAA